MPKVPAAQALAIIVPISITGRNREVLFQSNTVPPAKKQSGKTGVQNPRPRRFKAGTTIADSLIWDVVSSWRASQEVFALLAAR